MQQATHSGYVSPQPSLPELRELMLLLLLSGVRPYGVSLLIAGWDITRGPTLYQVDPSGSYWAWKASAIGKNMVNAKTFLEKRCACLTRAIEGHPMVGDTDECGAMT